jgi:tRNA-dihydrouridine synthase B
VHGRTRECRFKGYAEYDTIAAIKNAISIPVIANGDIDSPHKAAEVLKQTQVDGLMIGRSAQGRPWIFKEIEHYLAAGKVLPEIDLETRFAIIFSHLMKLHSFYGNVKGVWYARKHVAAYVKELVGSREFMKSFNTIESPAAQLDYINTYFSRLDEGLIIYQRAEAA